MSKVSGPTKRLLVRNLRQDTAREVLQASFQRFGPLKEVYLPTDPNSGQPRGFGFVEYEDSSSAQQAFQEMNNSILDDHVISVMFVESKEEHDRQRGTGPTSAAGPIARSIIPMMLDRGPGSVRRDQNTGALVDTRPPQKFQKVKEDGVDDSKVATSLTATSLTLGGSLGAMAAGGGQVGSFGAAVAAVTHPSQIIDYNDI